MSRAKISVILLALGLSACGKSPSSGEPVFHLAASSGPACETQRAADFQNYREHQAQWYVSHGFAAPQAADQSQLIPGHSGRTVVLIHGFISSPRAMQDLARVFHERGDTVLMPLLTGFGEDAHVANTASADDWRSSVHEALAIAHECGTPVSIVAHSLGAALVTEDLLENGSAGVAHLALLSPYFRASRPAVSSAIEMLRHWTDIITMHDVQDWTGGYDPYSWLPLPRPVPGQPEWALPLKALAVALKLQAEFALASINPVRLQPSFHSEKLATLVVVSEADGVIDPHYAGVFARAAFSSVEEVVYAAKDGIGHSIEEARNNPKFEALKERLSKFM